MTSGRARVRSTRGDLVESVHEVALVVLRPDGTPFLTAGDPDRPVYGRSALKPAQTVAVLRAGADLTDDEVAIASASHNGEPVHLAAVTALLARRGLTPEHLRCVPDLPLGSAAMQAYLAAGHGPTPLAMNCSGKHAAMLVAAAGAPEYLDPAHPLQVGCRAAVDELAGPVLGASVDGCGAPAFVTPLAGLARLAHALARPADAVVARVADAMRARPDLVAGTGRLDTVLMAELPGAVAKSGAEGVLLVALPDGTAIAAKVLDGAGRALGPVLLAVLDAVGVAAPAALRAVAAPPVVGNRQVVGELRAELAPATTG